MYGRTNSGSGGGSGELHGASIIVSTEESTLATTIAKLYKSTDLVNPISSKTFSSMSGGSCSVLFDNIQEVGTYFVKCTDGTNNTQTEDITITSNDIVNKTTQTKEVGFFITLTITLYSAVSDTVTYSDGGSDIPFGTTDSNGKTTNTITAKAGQTLTFKSSVADKPSDITQKYTKDIVITKNTNTIYLMPDYAVYWYGYINENSVITQKASYNPTTKTVEVATNNYPMNMNTNDFNASNTAVGYVSRFNFQLASEITAKSLHLIAKRTGSVPTSGLAQYISISGYSENERPDDKAVSISSSTFNTIPINTPYHSEYVYSSVNKFIHVSPVSGCNVIYTQAIWFEN